MGRAQKSWLKLIAAAAVSGVSLYCAPQLAHAEEDRAAQIEKAFREGVDLYEQGKYAEAQKKLHDVMALDPRKELAARLVDECGTRIMAKMMSDVKMGNEPTRIWQLYRQYSVQKLADKDRMTKLASRLVDPATSNDERAMLYREFGALGHHAVPYLAPYLKDATHEEYRTFARIAIARMGSRATLPVLALLGHKDALMRENAVLIIADIQPLDQRAIPALRACSENAAEQATVKSFAEHTLKRITGLESAAWKSAAYYYYNQANRYYLDRAGVAEEAEEVEGMVWHLNEAGDLVMVQYPLWAWNEQMAEDAVLTGLNNNAEYTDFYPLWACVQAAEYTKVKDLFDIVNEQPAVNTFSAEEKKDIETWDKKMVDARRLISAVGREHCNAALNKVHADIKKYPGHARLPQVGIQLANTLALLDPSGDLLNSPADAAAPAPAAPGAPVPAGPPSPAAKTSAAVPDFTAQPINVAADTPATPAPAPAVPAPVIPAAPAADAAPTAPASALIAGLDSSEEGVQYACALALAKIDRFPVKWAGAEKVGMILGRGVSENKAVQILLVEEKTDAANDFRNRFEKLGYGVTVAVSGRDALALARSFPPKDIAVVSESLRRDLTPEQLLEEMRADVRTRYLPVGILHLQADRAAIQARFGTEVPLVERENQDNDLDKAAKAIAAKRASESVPKRKAHEVAVACANALIGINSATTYIKLDDAVENAILALTNRPDDVRNPSAIFLGNVEGGAVKPKAAEVLKRVFEDANNAVEVRRNALRSLGRVQKEGLEDLYLKAQGDADQQIKDIGAEAYGQLSRANKSISAFIHDQRIDKASKEK